MCAVDLEMQASAPAQASPYRIQHRAGDARQNPYRGSEFLTHGFLNRGPNHRCILRDVGTLVQ